MAAKVRVGDTVQILAGKDRGARGAVLRVDAGKRKVVVERINLVKKHQKPSTANRQGGIIEREAPLNLSNVAVIHKAWGSARWTERRCAGARSTTRRSMAESKYVPRLLERYRQDVVPSLRGRFGYKNSMQVPRLQKVTLNVGLGEALTNARLLESAVEELAQISGQKAVITKAKKSIANFRLREGQSIGCMVTLRRDRMWEFVDRLINVALPRVRDFRGVSPRAFDGRGNYSLGVQEQTIFPEINLDKIERIRGLSLSITTTASTDEEGHALLRELGMPFRDMSR